MYVIVDIAGQQFKVEKDQKLFVHRLDVKEGGNIDFSDVMLLDDEEGKVIVGKPIIENAIVTAKVLSHDKGDKVLVFKKKRRKGYKKLTGHRQFFSKISIEGIFQNGIEISKEVLKETDKKSVKESEKPASTENEDAKAVITSTTEKTKTKKTKTEKTND